MQRKTKSFIYQVQYKKNILGKRVLEKKHNTNWAFPVFLAELFFFQHFQMYENFYKFQSFT